MVPNCSSGCAVTSIEQSIPGRHDRLSVVAPRDGAAAKRLFRKALSNPWHPQPRVINTDQALIYVPAIATLKEEGTMNQRCRHRPVQYLNNILEQVKSKQGFREFQAAWRTLQGYEATHTIRKGQVRWVRGYDLCQ